MDKFNSQFYNPETELEEKYSNEIHMHKVKRGTKKHDIIIQGLQFKTTEESKEFISIIKTKFGINGCCKTLENFCNKVYIFTGDKRDEIKNILIEKYDKDENFIKYHG